MGLKSLKTVWFKVVLACLFLLCTMIGIKADQQPVTLQVWDWWITQTPFINKEIELFQQKYPYIQIKRTKQIMNKYRDLVNFAQRSGSLPDILAIPHENIRVDWMRNNFLLPLNKWVDNKFINRFPKGSFVNGINMYDGKIYSYPFVGPEYWCQVYYNASVFKKAGLVDKKGNPTYPKTWAEVRKYAKQITKKGKGQYYGFGMFRRPEHLFPNFMYEWARVAGARAGNQELHMGVDYKVGRYNFTESEGYMMMFKFIFDLQKDKSMFPNGLSIDDETMRAAFADGKIAMIMGGTWNQTGWMSTHPDFKDYDCAMIPPPDSKGYRAFCPVEMAKCWYGIGATTKYPEEAWKFVEWFANPEVGARWVKSGNGISIFPSANIMANAKTKQFGQYLEISAKYAKAGPMPLARNPQLAEVVLRPVSPNHIDVFWGIVSGAIPQKDIPKAMKSLEDRMNKALTDAFDEAIKKGYKVSMDDLKFPDWTGLDHYEQK